MRRRNVEEYRVTVPRGTILGNIFWRRSTVSSIIAVKELRDHRFVRRPGSVLSALHITLLEIYAMHYVERCTPVVYRYSSEDEFYSTS